MDDEKHGIEDNDTNGDEGSDDEEEYDSEMEIMNVNTKQSFYCIFIFVTVVCILFISLQICLWM